MLRYGFELEGFLERDNQVVIPNKHFPVDGFPGLVELRNVGGASLEESYSKILTQYLSLPKDHGTVNFARPEHVFSGKDMQALRAHSVFQKDLLQIKNIYGKSPRRLGNKTLAALQINFSNQINSEWVDEKGNRRPASYGLLDVYHIVSRLDKEFENEIRSTKRQPGMYAIKDYFRLEYRSLPNSVFKFSIHDAETLLNRIKSAVEGE
jgi:hypothetical protein